MWAEAIVYIHHAAYTSLKLQDGDPTFCRLDGKPVRDVGLIFDRTKVDAKMTSVEGVIHLIQDQTHYIFDAESGDTMKFDHDADLKVPRSLLISIWKI